MIGGPIQHHRRTRPTGPQGYEFRESGFNKTLAAIDADEKRYGGDVTRDESIARLRKDVNWALAESGIMPTPQVPFRQSPIRSAVRRGIVRGGRYSGMISVFSLGKTFRVAVSRCR
jgi:hypothetical protein